MGAVGRGGNPENFLALALEMSISESETCRPQNVRAVALGRGGRSARRSRQIAFELLDRAPTARLDLSVCPSRPGGKTPEEAVLTFHGRPPATRCRSISSKSRRISSNSCPSDCSMAVASLNDSSDWEPFSSCRRAAKACDAPVGEPDKVLHSGFSEVAVSILPLLGGLRDPG